MRKVPLTIIGVLARKGQNALGQDQDDIILMPISTARNRVLGQTQGKQRRVGTISVKTADGADMKAIEERINDLLRQRHKLQTGGDDDFTIRNLTEILQAQEASSRVLTLLLGAVASVSLLVGGIGIMNIMLVSVTERTREIGLRMAVGARGARHSQAVSGRGGDAVDDRRVARHPARRGGIASRSANSPTGAPTSTPQAVALAVGFSGRSRRLLRLLSRRERPRGSFRSKRCATNSGAGAALIRRLRLMHCGSMSVARASCPCPCAPCFDHLQILA